MVVEVVDIDLAVRFEMARDKLTKRSLTWKKSRCKAKFSPARWRGERVKWPQSGVYGAATAETKR
jgi:hypothetical protein